MRAGTIFSARAFLLFAVIAGIVAIAGCAKVPDVVGKSAADAEAAISSQQLKYKNLGVDAAAATMIGSVVTQTPAADTMVGWGTEVAVSLSKGLEFDDYLGKDIQTAMTELAGFGLAAPTTTSDTTSVLPKGQITAQSPAAGTQVDVHTPIAFTVALGPTIIVPDLVGKISTGAKTDLQALGLTFSISGPDFVTRLVTGCNLTKKDTCTTCSHSSNVGSSSPAAGTLVFSGTLVALTTSDEQSDCTDEPGKCTGNGCTLY